MRATQWLFATLKETPSDAEISSHQLMLRAGMIRKLGAGLYTWLPMGLRVLRKVEQIVREEMNKASALEVLMPAVQPAELWHETGRWETFGGQLLTMQDSNGRDYCFGPTHEEVITDLMRQELQSYKQLPINVYQIQTKFRDEIRPRFGVMRAREFIMKDAYSFHLNQESLQETYEQMYKTYCAIFDRLGLEYRAVEADTGAIGGSASHEFQVMADAGEDLIFYSDSSSYAANVEQAHSLHSKPAIRKPQEPLNLIATPGKKTIGEVAAFLKVGEDCILKTILVEGREQPLVALVLRGDDELNEIKAAKHPLVKSPLHLADEAVIQKELGNIVGYVGPVGLSIPIIADHEALAMTSFICGANQLDKHYEQASFERDVPKCEAYDLRRVKEGDRSPDGNGKLRSCRGIEVGHIFQLGDKYAKAMQATVLDEAGQNQIVSMGCYGLGISRVVAAAIEQHHDERGIIWPKAMAPFQLVIIPINYQRSEEIRKQADAVYKLCQEMGIEAFLDDRAERPGVLFADHDLIGIPHRMVFGERNQAQGMFEYKKREKADAELIALADLAALLEKIKAV